MYFKNRAFEKHLLILSAILIFTGISSPAHASIPSGYQSFYVLGNSASIIEEAVDPAVGLSTAGANPYSVFSVVSYQDETRIYVDQKGNGYTFQKGDFTGADAVFRLDKGGVITFDNWVAPYYQIIPGAKGALIGGSLDNPGAAGVDGGDYFFVAGGPLSVFRGATDRRPETGDGNFIAGMWELYPVEQGGDEAQKSYVVPAGEDTVGTDDFLGGGEVDGGTFVVVQSTADGTVVSYSMKGVPGTENLGRGDSFVIQHVNEGDYIVANNKIQVGLIASGGENYDIRYFTLKDERFTGNDFWVPTFPSGSSPLDIRYHIRAITDASVTIETDAGVAPGWSPRAMAAGTTDVSFTTAGDTPVHISAEKSQRIIILVSVDTGEGDRDWGYVPIDASTLVSEYFVPYAPSGRTSSQDMQLYVSPIFDGTTIYADYNQDAVVDELVTLNKVESHGFFDASDMDNTGTHLFADFPFTVVYGESIHAQAGGPLPGYDWGYTIIPLDYTPANIVLDIEKTAFPPTVSVDSVATFTLVMTTGEENEFNVLGVDVFDELPPGFTYLGPASITHTDGSITSEDPAIMGQTLTWDLSEDMQPGESITIEFIVTPTDVPAENYINTGRATGTDPFGNTYSPEATAFITVAPDGVVEGFITDVTLTTPVPVPGVTVELLDCSGTPFVLLDTFTDGNGFYDFTELLEGDYCVRYDPLDPALGALLPFSDDDPLEPPGAPLTQSGVFNLGEDRTHIHNFQLATPVDLYIVKTGPILALVGENITYSFAVGNLGFTAATGVQVTDSLCGTPAYLSGDTNGNDELDIDEEWIYTYHYIIQETDPDPLENLVEVTSNEVDLDPSDNVDSWSVDIAEVGVLVEKTLTMPLDGDCYVGDMVAFTIAVTNTGDLPLETVPLTDSYDPSKLGYIGANPPPDTVDVLSGALEWLDLTGSGSLDPLQTTLIEVTFVGVGGTLPGTTTDSAIVADAKVLDMEVYLFGEALAEVTLMNAEMTVSKTLKDPSGGYTDIGGTVVFRVTVTNDGDVPIQTVPLRDSYDPAKLGYIGASPSPDMVDELVGVLEWTDLTGPSSLPPLESLMVEMTFEALEYTDYGGTDDLADVVDAYVGDDKYLSGSDSATVVILSPVGGTVSYTPIQLAAPYVASVLAFATLLALAIHKIYALR
ncbi:hypothetical protein JXL21_12090 [Candidatus Bathyarchaeota archaeon]|nr:hypothetical protein [Candidatus Bathyarchaeota archaeon]